MTMAHDPTRSWPTGKGPDDTSIPGAAWLELLDGQAFPVVGAGVMVRDGNVWTPASSSNPLHTSDAALASLIGALNAAKETNPDAASASMLALLRGMLATFGKETTLAAVKAAAESLAQEDFATETTLAALLSAVGNLATEATLSGVKSAVDTLAGTVADGAQKVTLSGQIEVLYEDAVSTITAGSSVAVVAKRPTEFKEVRGGIAVTFATRGDWRLYVVHMHASSGNNFGSEDLVRLSDNQLGGSGAKNLLSSHFEVRVLNNNSFDAGLYRVSILGVR